ncbi:MAG: hypothetical protein PHU85_10550 [Phycisphaerae bacterium]|nr:hypothetical protein [Phycisphaerae bacterium]
MCNVKAKIEAGPIKEESIAYIETASGATAEVIVGSRQVGDGVIHATEVRREPNRVLIELPGETSRGDWRIWVLPSAIVGT